MGLSRTVFGINCDFHRKSQNFSTPMYFAPLAEGVPLGIGYWCPGQKTRMMWLTDRERSLTISSAVWIQSTNVTDGHRPTAKTALRIASRGKNGNQLPTTNGISLTRTVCKPPTLCSYVSFFLEIVTKTSYRLPGVKRHPAGRRLE